MGGPEDNVELQSAGCMALRNLAASPGVDANREAIIEQGGFDVIARALQIAGEIHYIFSVPGSEIFTLRYEKSHTET